MSTHADTNIPAYMINMIADHMAALVRTGHPADVDTMHQAVRFAQQDVQNICTELLAGANADALRNVIAADVYTSIVKSVAA